MSGYLGLAPLTLRIGLFGRTHRSLVSDSSLEMAMMYAP